MHCSMSNEKNFCHLVETLIQIICLLILLYVPSKQINLQVHEPTLILPNSLLPPLQLPNVSLVEFQSLGQLDNWQCHLATFQGNVYVTNAQVAKVCKDEIRKPKREDVHIDHNFENHNFAIQADLRKENEVVIWNLSMYIYHRQFPVYEEYSVYLVSTTLKNLSVQISISKKHKGLFLFLLVLSDTSTIKKVIYLQAESSCRYLGTVIYFRMQLVEEFQILDCTSFISEKHLNLLDKL